MARNFVRRRPGQVRAVGKDDQRQSRGIRFADFDHLTRGLFRLRIQPLIRDAIPRQETPDLVRLRRPSVADDANSIERRTERRLPVVQQIVHHPIQPFFGRIPWLHQVVVDLCRVDRANSGIRVCIGGQQGALGIGEEQQRCFEEFDTGHPGHPLVHQEQSQRVIANLELLDRFQRSPP